MPHPGPSRPDSDGRRRRRTAWCSRGCWPTRAVSLASRRRSSGNARAGSRSPGTPGCRHKRGRAPDGSCGRKRSAATVHTIHRPFFSPAQEPQDPRLRIAEDATDRGLRTETGKPIRIIEPTWFSHPRFMPGFSPRREEENPTKQGVSRHSDAFFTHSIGRRAVSSYPDSRREGLPLR